MSNKEEMFVNSPYSLEDLEQFRDEKGFIDLSEAGIKFTEQSREKKGTASRIKNWVDFKGRKALIRGEVVNNYSMYAELIIEEIARQKGVETAHYDLIKFKDENGNYVYGVLSESIIDFDKEDLITLHDLIGDEPEDESTDILDKIEYEETTKYAYVIQKLRQRLLTVGYDEHNVESIIKDLNKRLLFYMSVIDTDKHIENISFIQDEMGNLCLSPNYDSEFSLLLECDSEMIDFFLGDEQQLRAEVDIANPKIGIIISEEDGGFNSMWRDTLEAICEDDEVYNYYIGTIKQTVDMEGVLEAVEERIKAPLPERVRSMAKKAYQIRNEEMQAVLEPEKSLEFPTELLLNYLKPDEAASNVKSTNNGAYESQLLSWLVDQTKNIRAGEQLYVAEGMESNLYLKGREEHRDAQNRR